MLKSKMPLRLVLIIWLKKLLPLMLMKMKLVCEEEAAASCAKQEVAAATEVEEENCNPEADLIPPARLPALDPVTGDSSIVVLDRRTGFKDAVEVSTIVELVVVTQDVTKDGVPYQKLVLQTACGSKRIASYIHGM